MYVDRAETLTENCGHNKLRIVRHVALIIGDGEFKALVEQLPPQTTTTTATTTTTSSWRKPGPMFKCSSQHSQKP
jgi:hypothetical protein